MLALSFLRYFLLGSDTFPVEPVKIWEIKGLLKETVVDIMVITEGFTTDDKVKVISRGSKCASFCLHDMLDIHLKIGNRFVTGIKPGERGKGRLQESPPLPLSLTVYALYLKSILNLAYHIQFMQVLHNERERNWKVIRSSRETEGINKLTCMRQREG